MIRYVLMNTTQNGYFWSDGEGGMGLWRFESARLFEYISDALHTLDTLKKETLPHRVSYWSGNWDILSVRIELTPEVTGVMTIKGE